MRILQIMLPGASEFEKKCQRIDFASLSPKHEVMVVTSTRDTPLADVAHIYGPVPLPPGPLVGFTTPYVASSAPARSRLSLRRPTQPAVIASVWVPASAGTVRAEARTHAPEAVEEIYFASNATTRPPSNILGSFARPSTMNFVEQTLVRIGRFRDDVTWKLFDHPPSPDDLAGVDVWVDPAVDEADLDGFVAEAVVSEKIVVASRTEMNAQRLEQGRTGFLVPPKDPNELTHAILAALFKPEVAQSKIEAARQTAGKFRPRQRSRVLERIYETVIP
ncbi:MAG TPA: glycosyltransferase [Thermoanaerobaculia bacterium]